MKKILLVLMMALPILGYAQKKKTLKNPLRLLTVPETSNVDSIAIWDSNKIVSHVKYTDFLAKLQADIVIGGGSGNLSTTGTPLINQIPIFTNSNTVKGYNNFRFNDSNGFLTASGINGDFTLSSSGSTLVWYDDSTGITQYGDGAIDITNSTTLIKNQLDIQLDGSSVGRIYFDGGAGVIAYDDINSTFTLNADVIGQSIIKIGGTSSDVLLGDGSTILLSAIGGLNNLVEDLTPELGGDLDALTNNISNIDIITANNIQATSGTSNFGNINITSGTSFALNGSGWNFQPGSTLHSFATPIFYSGLSMDSTIFDGTASVSEDDYVLTYDNATNTASFEVPSAGSSADDTVYGVSWDGNTDAATKNSIYDKIETIASGGGSGDVTKVGTPVNNQLGVWTGDGTLEGESNLTYDGELNITGLTNILNTGTGSALIVNRTDGSIMNLKAGSAKSQFGFLEDYDFAIVSDTRANLELGTGAGTTRLLVTTTSVTVPTLTIAQINSAGAKSAITQEYGHATYGEKVSVPATSTSTGVVGQWAVDATHVYYCHAVDAWRRVATSTF